MKATKRNIAICGLTVVVCASLLAGVTYAWFTDSITNSGNTISSGDLKIDATAYDLGEGGKSYEINGKAYTFESEGQNLKTNNKAVIAETNWYPGQSSAKLFTVENVGSLDAAVSLDFFVSGDLTNALWFDFIQVGETGVVSGQFKERPMETLPKLAEQLGDVKLASKASMSFVLVYGMEEEAQNEYMNKSFQVNVFISAKQTVEGAEGPVVVNPGTDLSEAIKEVSDNSTIVLAANSEYEVKNPIDLSGKKGIVIDGNGATITMNESIEGASFLSFAAMRANAETRTNYQKSIIRVKGASDVIIRNLTIEGSESHGINVYDCSNVTIEDVNINNSAELAICVNGSDVSLVNVHTSGSGWGAVNLDLGTKGTSSLTVDADCQFEEYLQIYADSTTVADKVSVNAAGYNRYNVVATDGNNRVLWTNNENVVEGAVFVDDAEGLASAVAAGGNVILASDIEASIAYNLTADVSVNLNSFTLNDVGTSTIQILNGAVVEFMNGNLIMNNLDASRAVSAVNVLTGSSLTFNSVSFTCNSVGLYPSGDAAKVEILNSKIYSNLYAVGTNARSTDNYNVAIIIENSYLETNYNMDNDGGSITVFVNVPSTLTIKNSTIVGVQNAVMVRGGTATIENSELSTVKDIKEDISTYYTNGAWGSGNYVPFATLLMGNRENASYNYATSVTLTNCTITSNNEEVPAIYIWGNKDEAAKAVLNIDTATFEKLNGTIDGTLVSTETSKVEINGSCVSNVSTEEELKAAFEKGGIVVLNEDIEIDVTNVVNPDKYTDHLYAFTKITKDTILNLNGKKISVKNAENLGSLVYYPLLISVNSGTLIINGDGVIDAEAGNNGCYAIDVFGGSLIVNGGTYYGAPSAIQVEKGSLTINGGYFELAKTIAAVAPQYSNYLINCIDAAYKSGIAKITITGGSYLTFDPSADPEGAGTTYVADGYTVEVSEVEGDHILYTVVPDTGAAE